MKSIREHMELSIFEIKKSHYSSLKLENLVKDFWTLSFVLDGDLITRIAKQEQRVRSGDVMIHPPKTPFTEITERHGTHIHMLFDIKFTHDVSFFNLYPIRHVVSLLDPKRFTHSLEQLLELYSNPDSPIRQTRILSVALTILEDIYDSWVASGAVPREEGLLRETDRFHRLIAYMEENLHHKIQRGDMAAYMCLHPSYFNRAFKMIFGKSPMQLLKEMRLKRAEEYLETTNYSLNTVASLCGLGDAAYFCRTFRQEYGRSPSDYRKRMKDAKIRFIE